MGRRKGSLNKSTLAKMGLDKYKINPQNDGKKAQIYPQNDGKENKTEQPKKKRIRRTRKQLIADGYYDKKTTAIKVETPKIKINTDRGNLFLGNSLTSEQVSDRYIQRAKEMGKENWEQDFRNDYEKGQKIYYVKINNLCHSKELLELYVGTIYSKVMVCWEDKGASYSIGIDDIDKIFFTEKEARKYYQKVRVE